MRLYKNISTKQKNEHPNLVLYKIDSTDYGFSKISQDSKQLQSSTKDGKILLDMAPYFLYTPTLYVIEMVRQNMLELDITKVIIQLVYGMWIQLLISIWQIHKNFGSF